MKKMTITYAEMTPEEIMRLGKNTGKNVMKSKYFKRGLEDYNPWKPQNINDLEDFEGDAILAIYEYLKEHNLLDTELDDDDLIESRRTAYRKCNDTAKAIRNNVFKHLFIEQMTTDEDGETIVTQIVDVTAEIRDNDTADRDELLKALQAIMTAKQWEIIKMYAKGYTDETIARKMGITQQTINILRHRIQKKALTYCKANGIDPSEYIRTLHRTIKNGQAAR